MNAFYSTQLEWIYALQSKNPLINDIFKCFDFFDRQEFFFILIPMIWVGYHWKSGLKLFYLIMFSGLINYALKQIFSEPRPFHLDPNIAIIQVAGYGFPSGAAQTAILLSGIVLNHLRNRWGWIIAINYVFWISLSRIYLGVHFPTDILGGWIVGALLWTAYTYLEPPLERTLTTLKPISLLSISITIPLVITAISQSAFTLRFCIPMIAIGIGTFISHHYRLFIPYPKSHLEFFLRAALGVIGTFVIYSALKSFSIHNPYLKTTILTLFPSLWISLGAMYALSNWHKRT